MSQYFDNDNNIRHNKRIIEFYFNDKNYNLYSDNGVFSKDKFDYGSKLLLETITQNKLTGKALDLGCGYGVIGILLANTYPQLTVDMVDITDRAINLSQKNSLNLNLKNVNIFKSNIYENITKKYNYIITNPPIRAGKETIRKFLLNAKEYLELDGQLWFVMRKDHGVKSMIKELEKYYIVTIEQKSKGFYIVKCQVK